MSDPVREPGPEETLEPPAAEAQPAAPVVLEVEGLRKSYRMGGEELRILDGIDLAIHEGEILTIVGKSGSGKSTLLNLIGLLDDPDEGRLIFRGGDLYRMRGPTRSRFRSREIGFVFQLYHLLPELDVVANTLLPAMIRYTWLGWQARKRRLRERAESLLERVGMSHRLRHRPSQLSGGERQRVAIARALMNDPAVVLCDEPTGNLDERTSEGIVELILDLNRTLRKTFVIVTHERDVAALGHRRIRIEHGKLVFEATAPI